MCFSIHIANGQKCPVIDFASPDDPAERRYWMLMRCLFRKIQRAQLQREVERFENEDAKNINGLVAIFQPAPTSYTWRGHVNKGEKSKIGNTIRKIRIGQRQSVLRDIGPGRGFSDVEEVTSPDEDHRGGSHSTTACKPKIGQYKSLRFTRNRSDKSPEGYQQFRKGKNDLCHPQPHNKAGDGPKICPHLWIEIERSENHDNICCTRCGIVARKRAIDIISSGKGIGIKEAREILAMRWGKSVCKFDGACTYCKRKGHTWNVCPLVPTEPVNNFAKQIMESSPVAIDEEYPSKNSAEKNLQLWMSKGKDLNSGNPWRGSSQWEDRLRKNAGFFKALGAPKSVLSWILNGVPARTYVQLPRISLPNHRVVNDHKRLVHEKHQTALKEGWFRTIYEEDADVISPIQIAFKKDKQRFCHDTSVLNAFIPDVKFKYETLSKDAANIFQKDDLLVVADITKAFYTLMNEEKARPKFCTRTEDGTFMAIMMIFGYKLSPFYFHMTMKPFVSFIRHLRIRCMNYVDDWIFAGKQSAEINIACRLPKKIILNCGFQFNEKTIWTPAKKQKFLGFIIDTKHMLFKIPQPKKDGLMAAVKKFLANEHGSHPISQLSSIVGTLNSLAFVEQEIALWLRGTFKFLAQKQSIHLAVRRRRTDDFLLHFLPEHVMQELHLCMHMVSNSSGRMICKPPIDTEFWVDTGEWATGFHGPLIGYGTIPLETTDLFRSSTRREMRGLLAVLKSKSNILKNMHVKAVLDNHAAVRIDAKNGGPVTELVCILKDIRAVQRSNNIILTTTWVRREENSLADTLSKNITIQWELQPSATEKISRTFPGVPICTPNFNTIAQQFHKIRRTGEMAIIIHPVWKSASWWTLMQGMHINSVKFSSAREVFVLTNNPHVNSIRWKIQATLCGTAKLNGDSNPSRKRTHSTSMYNSQPYNKAGDGPDPSKNIIETLLRMGAELPREKKSVQHIIDECKSLLAASGTSMPPLHLKTAETVAVATRKRRLSVNTVKPENGFDPHETAEQLRSRMVTWINSNRPTNTMRTYDNAQKQFTEFCNKTGRLALPATPETVTAFMKACSERNLKAGTINGAMLAGISSLHADAGLPTPTKEPIVKRAKKIIARTAPPAKRTIPIHMQQVLDAARGVDKRKFIHVRDFTVLLYATCATMRPCEIVTLRQKHVVAETINTREGPREAISIFIQERKNDQEREGHTVLLPRLPGSEACPFAWTARMRSFTASRANSTSPVFCKSHKSTMAPLSKNTVKTCIRNALIRGGVTTEDAKLYVTNSARAGGFSAAVANGTHPIVMKHHGGWKSDAAFVYLQETNAMRLNVTQRMLQKDQPQFHHRQSEQPSDKILESDTLRTGTSWSQETMSDDSVCQEKTK